MAIKKTKSFSPYNYGIRYRKIGENPFQKYGYIAAGGPGEPVFVVTKKEPSYFCSITNYWYYNMDDDGNYSFLKCDSTIFIDKEKRVPLLKLRNISSSFKSLKYVIKPFKNDLSYSWFNNKILNIFHNINVEFDSVVMINDEYVDNKCIKYHNNNSIKIDFLNIDIKLSDEIIVIVYSIETNENFINSKFINEALNFNDIINDEINNKFLIENKFGIINNKYIIKNFENKILNFESYDVSPSYISMDKSEMETLDQIKTIISYSPIDLIKTFIIQRNLNNNDIIWFENSVIINHNFGGDVNFIIDRNDSRKMIKKIFRIDNNKLKIVFNNLIYDPNVFSISVFKIGE